MQTIFPFLRYKDARGAIRWLCMAFGFVELELFAVLEAGGGTPRSGLAVQLRDRRGNTSEDSNAVYFPTPLMVLIVGVWTHACPPKRLCQVETRLVKSVSSIFPLARKLRSGASTSDSTFVRLRRLPGLM